jgi:predicted protein tyrosine phosphatase
MANKNVLFVCSQNKLRSPTAESVFSQFPELECQSAGTDPSANVPLDPELIEWADVIFVMEKNHRNKIMKKFKQHLNGKRIVVLGIPDDYECMDPGLIRILQVKVGPLLGVKFGN